MTRLFGLLHVAAGSVALLSMWVPLFTAKGSKRHRLFGKVYAYSMAVVVVSALLVCALRLSEPLPEARRNGYLFLAVVALFSAEVTWYGVRVLKQKRRTAPHTSRLDWAVSGAAILACGAGVVYGVTIKLWLLVGFGAAGVLLAAGHLREYSRPPVQKQQWLLGHLGNMLGACIGTITAFLVVNFAHLPAELRGLVPPWLVWVAPSLVGVPAIMLWSRKYERPKSAAS